MCLFVSLLAGYGKYLFVNFYKIFANSEPRYQQQVITFLEEFESVNETLGRQGKWSWFAQPWRRFAVLEHFIMIISCLP